MATAYEGQFGAKVTTAVLTYMAFSSTMLITNKAAVMFFPLPSFLLFLQMAVSALMVWALGQFGYLKVDALEWGKIKAYMGVVAVFIFNLFTNIKALYYCNVETVIVFQTLTSLGVAYGDWRLLNSAMPSRGIIISLLIIVFGAVLYVFVDSAEGFKTDAYFWVALYFVAKVTDMLYTKHIVDTVPMSSWGRSFYNNILATVPVLLIALVSGEDQKFAAMRENGIDDEFTTYLLVGLSCLMGLGISISGFVCREMISATSFSVVGNMNKVLTVFINYIAWDSHTSAPGLFSLSICILGGAYYAKVRQDEETERKKNNAILPK
eukprot:TRINITY_DN3388_c0_g1_i4.p1 TRINITY_DN3388_c0_g1~~TRINITY_DN3388_c0_g1_i4.p1  ORF type:complete len:322 (-),score=85.01 TRINITY_DN3388_c0_g1_i4:176-1141(-)